MADLSAALISPHDPPVVLLVDDDPDTNELYAMSLTGSGFAVEQATSGEDALARIGSVVPDIVVADIVLPGMDGFALCREIKRDERTAHVPVIAVTGYSSPTRMEEATRAGFQALLLKPCLPDDLLAQIRRSIAETRALCGASRELQAKSATLRRAAREIRDTLSETMKRCLEAKRRRDSSDC